MPSGVVTADRLGPDGFFRGLFVGPKSSGKTVAACSFYKNKKVLDLDFDGRIRGILGVDFLDKSRIDYKYFPPRTGSRAEPTYIQVNTFLDELMAETSLGTFQYDTIVLDSITSETFCMLNDAVPLTHTKGGKKIGSLNMAGPEDYGFEATATYNILAFLRSLPVNLIVTAHIVDRFGKADPNDKYSESIVIGQKLSIRDKIGANIGIYFDHIFEFDREMMMGAEQFTFQARSNIATTSFKKLPVGKLDITGKNFYKRLMEVVKDEGFPEGTEAAAMKMKEVSQ